MAVRLPELHHAKRFLEILLAALQTENPHGAEEARHDAIRGPLAGGD